MAGLRIIRKLRSLLDVDDSAIADGKVPVWRAAVSSHQDETIGGGGGVDILASDQTYTSGTGVISGGANITVGAAGSTITISGGAGAGGGVAISASDTVYTSGTVEIAGTGGGVTIGTDAPQKILVSVLSQSEQTQNVVVPAASNTTYTSGTVVISGGANVTVSTNGQTIGISARDQSVQPAQTGISGISASDTLYTSGTVRITGAGAVTVGSDTGQRVVISAPVQSAQTGISSIQASDATYTSGKVIFTGVGGGVTVSSNTGQRVDISVAAPVAQTAQTGISSIAASNTTYTSGQVEFTGSNMVTVKSSANQRVVIDATQSVQTQGVLSIGASTGGNTSGNTTVNTGSRLVFVGSNNITVSQGTAAGATTLTLSGPSAQTGISGISASNTNYTSGTVLFTGSNMITVKSSAAGQTVILDATQSVQTQGILSAGVSTGGNTSGNTTVNTGSRLVFVGSNGITLSEGTAAGASTITISGITQSNQSAIKALGVSNTGNTAGNTGVSTGIDWVIAGSNNITASESTAVGGPNTIWISGPTVGGAQTGISGIANSQTTYTSGTVSMSELGAITIRSTTGNQYQFSVAAQTVESQSIGMSNVGNTSGTTGVASGGQVQYVLAGGNNITLSQSLNGASGTVTISAFTQTVQTQDVLSVGASNVGNTSGNTTVNTGSRLVIAGGNNITVSQGTAAGATTLTISAFTQSVQTQDVLSVGASTGGNTAGNTTVNTGSRLVFVGSNNITVSQGTAAGATTLTISGPTQTVESQSIGMSNVGNTSGTTGVASGGQVQYVLAGGNNITLSQSLNGASGTVTISAFTQSVESQSIGMSNIGNTSGTTGIASGGQVRFVFAGGNNITLSQSLNGASGTITISAPNLGAGAMSVGVSTGGNTAGATGVTGTRLVLVGSGNITLSQTTDANGGTVSIYDTVSAYQAGVSTGGNTTGNTGVTGTRLVFAGSSPITLSQDTGANGGTITIQAPATSSLSGTGQVQISTNGSTISIGVPNPIDSYYWPPAALQYGVTQGIGNSAASRTTVTAFVMPLSLPNDLAFNNLDVAVNNSFSSATTSISSVNWSYSMGASLGFYTLNVSTMSLVTSYSASLGVTNATSANATDLKATGSLWWGNSSSGVAITGAGNMSSVMSSISGARLMPLVWSTQSETLTRGQYFVVAMFTQLTGGNAQGSLTSIGFVSNSSIFGSALNPPRIMKSTASVTSPVPFLGQATLVNSSNSLMPPSFETSVITTATAIANSSKFQSVWFRIMSSHSH